MKQKKLIIVILIVLISQLNVFSQKTEYRISLNSGLLKFTDPSTGRVTFSNFYKDNSLYTNNQLGEKNGLCYGLSSNIRRVTKPNLIIGFDLGYEVLRSKISIGRDERFNDNLLYQHPDIGQTILTYQFVNINPFLGYRIHLHKTYFDVSGGLDIGFCLNAKEKGNAELSNGTNFEIDRNIEALKHFGHHDRKDIRSRFQLSTDYKEWGIYVGYSFGLSNYYDDDWDSSQPYGGSRLIRFGLTYLIN